ncbi:MAG: hypothetical protein LUD68_05320, partial [Rikenellaceae bacterium]|nr:hypothetical protein [Rikenellaceae bacterium]
MWKPFCTSLFLMIVCTVHTGNGQEGTVDFNDVMSKLFTLQRYYYPQEKAYLHFDRNHYIAGDTIWFRGYLVNAATHTPDTSSRYLYVDLVDPADSVVTRCRIRRQEGGYPGYVALPDDLAAGNYTLWAYTLFMRNTGAEFFFQAPVRISDPLSLRISEQVRFFPSAGAKDFSVAVQFQDLVNQSAAKPNTFKAGMNRQTPRTWTSQTKTYDLSFRNVDTMRHNVLLIDYDKSRKFIEVPPPQTQFDVSFHPEGGYLVVGQMNTVGFKAVNVLGQSIRIRGKIFNSNDELIGEFEPEHRGIGTFTLFSQPGESCYAVCTDEQGFSRRFELPEPRTDVYGLKAVLRSGYVYTTLSVPEVFQDEELYVIVQSRGEVMYTATVPQGQRNLRFNTLDLPSGVAHILLVDSRWNILNERLVFIRNDDQAHVRFSADKPQYGRREKVTARVELTDYRGNPLEGTLSVAVTDNKDILPDSPGNIYTELLLSSDLKGYIESPAWYFEADDPSRHSALDALMMTQGWRRYEIPGLLQKRVVQPA